MKKTEDTMKLIESLIQDMEDLITNMKNDYVDIIYDQKKTIDFLQKANNLMKKERSER